MTRARKVRSAVSRCPHCEWVELFFGTNILELKLRAVLEQIFHIATRHGGL